MKSVFGLRQSLGLIAVITLTACGGAQSVSPNIAAGSNSGFGSDRVVSNHGRKFRAAYSGTYSKAGDCSATAMFTYEGNGNGRFLPSSGEQIKLTWFCGSQGASGSATLTSIHDPKDSITADVSSTDFKSPCYYFTMSFTLTGGTGKFRRAAGSGTIYLYPSSSCLSYSYSDKWRGTWKF